MKVLVTGGTGYIGSHTVVELMEKGFEVVIVDNLSNSFPEVVDSLAEITGKRPDFIELDLADPDAANSFFEEYKGIDTVIHFAAYKAVGESVEKPLMYYRNNLYSLINLMENMQKHGIGNLVFSSSCTVYGQPESCRFRNNRLLFQPGHHMATPSRFRKRSSVMFAIYRN